MIDALPAVSHSNPMLLEEDEEQDLEFKHVCSGVEIRRERRPRNGSEGHTQTMGIRETQDFVLGGRWKKRKK